MSAITLEQMKQLAGELSLSEKADLVQWLGGLLKSELPQKQKQHRRSIRGIWKGVQVSDNDIADVRMEMWRNFPREDF